MSALTIYTKLKAAIGNDFGVFGLMGNIKAESNLRSNNLQNTFEKKLNMTDDEYAKAVDNGTYKNFVRDGAGFGLAQWTWWSRKENLLKYAKSKGKSIADESMQLEFMIDELKTGYIGVFNALKNAKSIREASDVVLTQYERPADMSDAVKVKRASFGEELYKEIIKEREEENTMGYTNSKLVDCKVMSPNHSGTRTHKIDRITPHCVVGQLSAENIGHCFPNGRNASCNYGIGYDGRICLIVDEQNRSWCTSSNANDQRAITIEVASDKTEPYTFTNEAYKSLVDLCVDICKRNGINKVYWFGDKDKSLNYSPKDGECVLTVHRWFANKSCPGDWMYSRMGKLADAINNEINVKQPSDVETKKPTDGDVLYRVQCGAYKVKENADKQLKAIKARGIDAFITQVDGYYKVQVGAYSIKDNAELQLSKMKALGFDCFITEVKMKTESFTPRKSAEEIAKEIWTGKCSDSRWSVWGNGTTRKERLEAAGYDYNAVQAAIKKLYG